MTESVDIKPCPCCGQKGTAHPAGNALHFVICISCGLRTNYALTRESAIATWNRRLIEELLDEYQIYEQAASKAVAVYRQAHGGPNTPIPNLEDLLDWLLTERADARREVAAKNPHPLLPVVLALWQKGHVTAFSVVNDKFVEGFAGKPVLAPLTQRANQVLLRPENGAAGFRLRSLTQLVASVPGSFVFERVGDDIRNITAPIDDTPWRVTVGDILLTHFVDELRRFMPQGVWNLDVTLDFEYDRQD